MFLTPEELVELTHAKRSNAQVRALCMMGIEHKQRPDGSVVVLRAHVERLFGGTTTSEKPHQKIELNLAALDEWQKQVAERRKKK